ncbi:structural protein [Enterovibrio nigricans]|uniref:Structural protein P5 n=1 Tax=Enterovibrio nigricans DSM 22720 TaxID=1121868 RepID=A0A1T4WFG4_9GAMM|nr:structural protein [Enterovibrio nigricans]SKA76043.1 hypothetical protein SAMN02745132_04913 [Enterovibrio nigricans DSM 22720]
MTKPTRAPRGIRNHNPGNLEDNNTPWLGRAGNDGRYLIFTRPEYGLRALYKVLLTYRYKYNVNTVEGILHRWAPPVENDTNAYVKHVAQKLGVLPHTPLSMEDYPALVKAIVLHENGVQPYSDEVIAHAIALAR